MEARRKPRQRPARRTLPVFLAAAFALGAAAVPALAQGPGGPAPQAAGARPLDSPEQYERACLEEEGDNETREARGGRTGPGATRENLTRAEEGHLTLDDPCLVPVPLALLRAPPAEFEEAYLLRLWILNQASRDLVDLAGNRTEDPGLRNATGNVTDKLTAEAGNLTTLLRDRHNETAPEWNETGMGRALETRMEKLGTLTGEAFDRAYVNATIEHKLIAAHMSDFALERAPGGDVRTLAEETLQAKRADIAALREWRDEKGREAPQESLGLGLQARVPGPGVLLLGGVLAGLALARRRLCT